MATLLVNGDRSIEIEAGDQDSVFDVLLKAQDQHWGEQSHIDALKINGETLEALNEATLKAIPAEDAEIEVTVSEQKPRSQVEIITESTEYLTRLETGLEAVAGKIRMESEPAAYQLLSEGLDGLSTILELCEALRAGEDVPEELNAEFQTFLTELNEKLQELNDAQECEDPTLIADIIEYEFVEVVQDLKGYLDRFKEIN